MAHSKKNPTLGCKAAPRKALLVGLSNALLLKKRLITTKAKAKALQSYIAPILSKVRRRMAENPMQAHQQAFASLRNKAATKLLFEEVLPRISNRPGGYTRVIALGPRAGDNAFMALIELVDYNTNFQKSSQGRFKGTKGSTGQHVAHGSSPTAA